MNEDTKLPEPQVENPNEETRRPRLAVRLLGLAMIITAVLLVWYAAIVYIGYVQGQELLQEKRVTTLTTQIDTQLELARQNINDSQYNLARTRLNWVLEHAPNNQQATTLLTEIDTRLNITPTVEPAETPTATPLPLPMPTPGLIGDPDEELTRIERIVKNERWEDAIKALLIYQFQYPNYKREITDKLLYDAYIAEGLKVVQGEQVELGIAYFAEAEKLGDLPQEALDYQFWAELYMAGIAYYGVNWNIATANLRELCLAAPFFQDSCSLLDEARRRAAQVPATPFGFISDTVGITDTVNVTDTVVITNTETITNP